MDHAYNEPDPRWGLIVGSLDASGVRMIEQGDLAAATARWPVSGQLPENVAWGLRMARSLWVQSWWCYEFLALSVAWALFTLDAALRRAIAGPAPSRHADVASVLTRAEGQGLLDSDEVADLRKVFRHLRNSLAHVERPVAYTVGIAEPILRQVHEIIVRIYAPD